MILSAKITASGWPRALQLAELPRSQNGSGNQDHALAALVHIPMVSLFAFCSPTIWGRLIFFSCASLQPFSVSTPSDAFSAAFSEAGCMPSSQALRENHLSV